MGCNRRHQQGTLLNNKKVCRCRRRSRSWARARAGASREMPYVEADGEFLAWAARGVLGADRAHKQSRRKEANLQQTRGPGSANGICRRGQKSCASWQGLW